MNRFGFILGFALLGIAATLAVSISMRNAPASPSQGIRSVAGTAQLTQRLSHSHPIPAGPAANANSFKSGRQAGHEAEAFRVTLHETRLAALPAEQQSAWRTRAAAVEADAHARLGRLTAELELTATQRDKMFPVLVRSTPGFDPLMLVGGSRIASESAVAAAEAIHQTLNPQQQILLENREVNRQLWWQDILSRLEADLIDSTGGVPAAPAMPAMPATEERIAPAARDDGNLFDLLEPRR